jgi:hypothetical protein
MSFNPQRRQMDIVISKPGNRKSCCSIHDLTLRKTRMGISIVFSRQGSGPPQSLHMRLPK